MVVARLARAARIVAYAASGVVVAAVVMTTVGPRFLPYRSFVVLSASMAPSIPVGSVVVAIPTPRTELVVGDVITYQRVEEPDMPVTHRVSRLRALPGELVARTKGDANDVEDPWEVNLAPSVLRVAGSIPLLGYVLYYAQTSSGRTFTFLLPLGALVATFALDALHARRRAPGVTST